MVGHNPASEADHVSPQVDDGEHDPVSKPVQRPLAAVPPLEPQIGPDNFLIPESQGTELSHQSVTGIRRVSQAEVFDGPLGKPPAPEIGQSVFPFLTVKAPVEKSGGFPVSLVNPAPDMGGGLVPAVLRQLHSRPLGKEFHRVYVIQILNFPDKGNNVSSGSAAKAVKIALLRVHMEGRGLFPMKGAQSGHGPARALQVHIA